MKTKKKIFLLSTFILIMFVVLYNVGSSSANAETTQNCQTYTNYYLMMDATTTFGEKFATSDSYQDTTIKDFRLLVDSDAEIISQGIVEVDKDSYDSTFTPATLSLSTFHSWYLTVDDNVPATTGNIKYIRAVNWSQEGGEETNQQYAMPTNFNEFSSQVPNILNTPTVNVASTTKNGENVFRINISRTWNKSDMTNVDTSKIVYSPSAYYIQYKVCDEAAPTYKVTVYHQDNTNKTNLVDPIIHKEGVSGTSYDMYICPTTFPVGNDTYKLSVTSVLNQGTIQNADINHYCYYDKVVQEEQKYKVTTNYLDNTKGTPIATAKVDSNYVNNSSYTTSCKTIDGYTLKRDSGNLTGTINGQDVTVNCYYDKNPDPTYKVITNYIDRAKNAPISDPKEQSGFKNNSSYETSCKDISGYTLNDRPSNLKGTINGQDITVNCYYDKNPDPTYNVVVNFYEKGTTDKLADTITHATGLKNGQSYTVTCPSDKVTGYVLSENQTGLTGTINNANAEVNCYYEKEKTYNVIAHYIDKDLNKSIKDPTKEEVNLKTGATYKAFTCPAITGYNLSKTDPSTFESGKIADKDVEFKCYYVKKDSYTVTVNYGTNNDCSEGKDIRKPDTKTYVEEDSVTLTIPEIKGYEYSNVGTVSPATFKPSTNNNKLLFTMPSKNASICLVYIQNKQTGSAWVYIAAIAGIATLAAGGWYLTRYYQYKNN